MVFLSLFDALGRPVLYPKIHEFQVAGEREIPIDVTKLAAGVYTVRLSIGDDERMMKIAVIH